jgi:hypothetical protein
MMLVCPMATIDRNTRPMVATSGVQHSPGPPPAGDACGIVPVHPTAIKMASKVGALFHCCFGCCRPGGCRGNMERVVARWRHPVASGLRGSPGHAASGNAVYTAPMHLHGHQNGLQQSAFIFCRRLFHLTLS